MLLKNELQTIISGVGNVTEGAAVQAVANHLRKSKAPSKDAKEEEFVKEQETETLIDYSSNNNFLFKDLQKIDTLLKALNKRFILKKLTSL